MNDESFLLRIDNSPNGPFYDFGVVLNVNLHEKEKLYYH